MPADCSQSPVIGRWAGKRVLVQGDYAEDDDIPGWQGPPLSLLHHSMDSQEERDDLTEHRKKLIAEVMKGVKAPDWSFPSRIDQIRAWLDANCGADRWVMAPAGLHGVLNDANHRRRWPALPAAALFPDMNPIEMRLRRGRVPRLK
jgi:hypothetical protein